LSCTHTHQTEQVLVSNYRIISPNRFSSWLRAVPGCWCIFLRSLTARRSTGQSRPPPQTQTAGWDVRPGISGWLSHPWHYCRGIGSSGAMMARGGWLGAGGAARPIGVKSSVTEDRRAASSQHPQAGSREQGPIGRRSISESRSCRG
jgi:hypothetical protein